MEKFIYFKQYRILDKYCLFRWSLVEDQLFQIKI